MLPSRALRQAQGPPQATTSRWLREMLPSRASGNGSSMAEALEAIGECLSSRGMSMGLLFIKRYNMKLSITEQLSYSTVRLECKNQNGLSATGTGFFFKFTGDDNKQIPVIITNKHVVGNMTNGKFIITKADDQGKPLPTQHFSINIDDEFEQWWVSHPDPSVDLCAMPIAPILRAAKLKNQRLFYRCLTKAILPTKKQREDFHAIEDILMVGYPNGIWDSVNNQPIFRKGTTATNPNMDYNGNKEFMIDIACFPGSSGSPVMIYNSNGFSTKSGKFNMGTQRLIFLGVLYAGPQHTAWGEIEIVNTPTSNVPRAISKIPNNLGLVIKSERILELEKIFQTIIKNREENIRTGNEVPNGATGR